MTEFGWDVKYAGVQTLVAKVMAMAPSNSTFTCSFLLLRTVCYIMKFRPRFIMLFEWCFLNCFDMI
jgi:hypothetical protein